jgi:hypothetical protein
MEVVTALGSLVYVVVAVVVAFVGTLLGGVGITVLAILSPVLFIVGSIGLEATLFTVFSLVAIFFFVVWLDKRR